MRTKLLYFLLLIAPFISTSCNKEDDPIILTGNWYIDEDYVYTGIRYDPNVGQTYPAAVQYLRDHEDDFCEPLKELTKITFSGTNQVTFQYTDSSTETGTYVQDGMYFVITCDAYPLGLTGGSDGKIIELYYPTEYMIDVLKNILTPTDPSETVFESLIQTFVGVATYRTVYY